MKTLRQIVREMADKYRNDMALLGYEQSVEAHRQLMHELDGETFTVNGEHIAPERVMMPDEDIPALRAIG